MDLELKGKSVIVTGGASNIGRAIVLAYAREGANLTIADLDRPQAESVGALARAAGAPDVLVVKADVTVLSEVQAMVAAAKKCFGAIDILVNNVGWDKPMFFTQTTPEFWDRVIRINFLGVLNCTSAVLDDMIAQKSGCIVSISSDASRQGESREAVYAGVKAGVNSFMKTIAKENGPSGIRCNVVCPGVTIPGAGDEVGSSSMWTEATGLSEEQLKKVISAHPLRKVGRNTDVANAVLFLSSSAAGHITGQVLSVSGGYTMIG